jgi:hypothetical protein
LKRVEERDVNMGSLGEVLREAADRAVEREGRAGLWAVAERYEVRYLSGRERVLRGVGKLERYAPLVDRPDLFLRFARLGETLGEGDTDANAGAALSWARMYGVLGLTEKAGGHAARGGPGDTVAAFAHEARVAGAVLRLYEAATAEPVDLETIREYPLPRHRDRASTPARARDWALGAVAAHVQDRLYRYAAPSVYRDGSGFGAGHDFRNLLGAMWLQMSWLLISDDSRRCKNPECNHVVAFEQPEGPPPEGLGKNDRRGGYRTRKDKAYCSDACRQRANYLKRRGPARHQLTPP